MIQFNITDAQEQEISKWLNEKVYPNEIERQKADPHYQNNVAAIISWDEGYPYEGAIGGGLKFIFVPNSVGLVIKVKYQGEELDLSDYEDW